jgi:hypothetical protein
MGRSVRREKAIGAVQGQAEEVQLPLGPKLDCPCPLWGNGGRPADDIEGRYEMTMYDFPVIQLVIWQCFCPLKDEDPLG